VFSVAASPKEFPGRHGRKDGHGGKKIWPRVIRRFDQLVEQCQFQNKKQIERPTVFIDWKSRNTFFLNLAAFEKNLQLGPVFVRFFSRSFSRKF
jgi:hypothetical protein